MSMNKTCAISSSIFFLTSADMFRMRLRTALQGNIPFLRRSSRATAEPIEPNHREDFFCAPRSVAPLSVSWGCFFRRARGGEFLKARILPERIEHRIEPEQRGSERHALS